MRNYKRISNQTRYEKSGVHNLPKDFEDKYKDTENDGLLENIIPIMHKGMEQRKRTTNWTADELEATINEFFDYCTEHDIKPCKAGLRLWLGVSKSQYHAWHSEPSKYGAISDLITMANDAMELQYVNRSEKYPTGNIFLLKTCHGYVETSKVDVTTNGNSTPDEVKDAIAKLGLDKQE